MSPPAFLLVLATVRDAEGYARHLAALPLLYARAGGRYLANAGAPGVEYFGGRSISQGGVVSYWPSMDQLRAFWSSTEHEALRRSCAGSGDFEAIALPGKPLAASSTDFSHLAAILGQPTSPAVFEHEGACPIAVARGTELTVLEGTGLYGGCALYGFREVQAARRVLAQFSSHRRDRALLAPLLAPLRLPQAA